MTWTFSMNSYGKLLSAEDKAKGYKAKIPAGYFCNFTWERKNDDDM